MATVDPNITLFSEQPANLNSLAQDNYQLMLEKFPNVAYFSKGVNLPGVNASETRQPTPMVPVMHAPSGNLVFDDLQVRFLVDEDLKNWLEIWNWMRHGTNVSRGDGRKTLQDSYYSKNIYTDAVLLITTNNKNVSYAITFRDCFPIGLTGLDFSADLPEHTVAESTVTFKYTQFEVEVRSPILAPHADHTLL